MFEMCIATSEDENAGEMVSQKGQALSKVVLTMLVARHEAGQEPRNRDRGEPFSRGEMKASSTSRREVMPLVEAVLNTPFERHDFYIGMNCETCW